MEFVIASDGKFIAFCCNRASPYHQPFTNLFDRSFGVFAVMYRVGFDKSATLDKTKHRHGSLIRLNDDVSLKPVSFSQFVIVPTRFMACDVCHNFMSCEVAMNLSDLAAANGRVSSCLEGSLFFKNDSH